MVLLLPTTLRRLSIRTITGRRRHTTACTPRPTVRHPFRPRLHLPFSPDHQFANARVRSRAKVHRSSAVSSTQVVATDYKEAVTEKLSVDQLPLLVPAPPFGTATRQLPSIGPIPCDAVPLDRNFHRTPRFANLLKAFHPQDTVAEAPGHLTVLLCRMYRLHHQEACHL